MSDLLEALGGEWAAPIEKCSAEDRLSATHGCRSCGRAPTTWLDGWGYVDGMGRTTRCGYCASCIGTGRTALRDPWTDALLAWHGAPCLYCQGSGYLYHRWDCAGGHGHLEPQPSRPVEFFGVTFDGRTFVPGEWPDHQPTGSESAS